ncbi:MAG: DUF3305 domain-containing protein, partial [Aeromonas veronii]
KKGKGRAQDQLGVDSQDQASCGAVKATGPDGRERGCDSGNRAHE